MVHFGKREDSNFKSAEGLTGLDLERLAVSGNVSYSFHLQQAFIAISAKFG